MQLIARLGLTSDNPLTSKVAAKIAALAAAGEREVRNLTEGALKNLR